MSAVAPTSRGRSPDEWPIGRVDPNPFDAAYTLPRRFIKTGIIFLAIGLLLGAYLPVRRELSGNRPHPHPVSAHSHLVLIGFVMFLILGVGLWIFPRPAKDDTRYRPALAEASYWILLVATTTRFLGEATQASTPRPWLGWAVITGGLGAGGGTAAVLLEHVVAHPAGRITRAQATWREVLIAHSPLPFRPSVSTAISD